MSTASLARSATETRIMQLLVPGNAARIRVEFPTIAKGRRRANTPDLRVI
jgi:hypothetical protein